MPSTFQVVIAANDKASAVVRTLRGEIAGVTRPVDDLSRSFRNLARETGVDKVVGALKRGTTAAMSFARSVAMLSAPVAALASAGIIGGIALLTNGWGRAAQELTNTSAAIGVNTTDLQRYRGAARLAGLAASDMDTSLQGLGDTMQGAVFGRNPQALALMNAYGMSIKRTKDGAIDSTAALIDLSKAIQTNMHSGGNIQSARIIASTFGSEGLLPLLIKGPEAIRSYVAEMDRLNAAMGPSFVNQGVDYAKNLTKLDLSVDSLKYSIGNALMPVLSPMIGELSKWVSKNKDVIASDVSTVVKDLANWLKQIDWNDAKKQAGEFFNIVSDAYGMLKDFHEDSGAVSRGFQIAGNYIHGRGGKTNAELASSGAAITPGEWYGGEGWGSGDSHVTPATKALFDRLESRENLPPGMLDSIWAEESGRGMHLRSKKGALGQFQFMPATAAQYGLKDPDDLVQSADAASRLLHDLMRQNGGNVLRTIAAYNYGQGNLDRYGMSNLPSETRDYVSDVSERIRIAQANGAGNVPSLYPGTASSSDHDTRVAALRDLTRQVEIHIDMKNAPPGTRLNATSKGNVTTSSRIAYAMDGTN